MTCQHVPVTCRWGSPSFPFAEFTRRHSKNWETVKLQSTLQLTTIVKLAVKNCECGLFPTSHILVQRCCAKTGLVKNYVGWFIRRTPTGILVYRQAKLCYRKQTFNQGWHEAILRIFEHCIWDSHFLCPISFFIHKFRSSEIIVASSFHRLPRSGSL